MARQANWQLKNAPGFFGKKIKAFTLVESLCSVTILAIAGTATFMAIEWVLASGQMPEKIQAEAVLHKAAFETVKNNRFIDETFDMDGFRIDRSVVEIPGFTDHFMLKFRALDARGKTITTYEEIAYAP